MAIANSSKIVTFQANRELVNDAMEALKEKNYGKIYLCEFHSSPPNFL